MKHLRIALALAALGMANAAMATSSTYSLLTNQSSSTGGVGTNTNSTNYGTVWNSSGSSAYGTGGTNYGNTYTWNAGVAGSGTTSLTLSAWGTTTASTSSTIQKAWLGDYGSPNGFGVTSQSNGELTSSVYNKNTNPNPNTPDADSPSWQHTMDNLSAYESLLFSFGSKVTLSGISIGFSAAAQSGSPTETKTDASIFEWLGSGDPTSLLAGGTQTWASMTCASAASTNCWLLTGDYIGMTTASSGTYQSKNATVDSKYWMVGAYIPVGGNTLNPAVNGTSGFKVNGVTTTTGLVTGQSVPEPASLALFGIAGVAFAASRRRARKA